MLRLFAIARHEVAAHKRRHDDDYRFVPSATASHLGQLLGLAVDGQEAPGLVGRILVEQPGADSGAAGPF